MLRKVRQQVSQALNAVNPVENRHDTLNNEEESFEGLLCPLCMRAFLTPNELQEHFSTHESQQEVTNTESTTVPSSTISTSINCGDVIRNSYIDLETEINELKHLLSDEKRYSSELRKELDRLHEVTANQSTVPKGEVPYLMQQIQALEAGKSMVTQRLLELEKTLSMTNRANESLKCQKEELNGRVADLTGKISNVSLELEEQKAEKGFLREELIRLKIDNERKAHEVEQLTRQLEQRPSEDDIKVLREELVRSQQLMDNITQERESEISEHINTIERLNQQKQVLETSFKQNRDDMASAIASLKRQLSEEGKEKEVLITKGTAAENKVVELEVLLKSKMKELEDSSFLTKSCQKKREECEAKLLQVEKEKKAVEEVMEKNAKGQAEALRNLSKTMERVSDIEKANAELERQVAELRNLLRDKEDLVKNQASIIMNDEKVILKFDEEAKIKDNDIVKNSKKIGELSLKLSDMEKELVLKQNETDALLVKLETERQSFEKEKERFEEESTKEIKDFEEKIHSLEKTLIKMKNEDEKLIIERENLQRSLEIERTLLAEKDGKLRQTLALLDKANETVIHLTAKVEDDSLSLEKLNRENDFLKEKLENAESSTNSLMAKIVEGEDGTKLAIEQLQRQNQNLLSELRQADDRVEKITEERDKFYEVKIKDWQAKLTKEKEVVDKLESTIENLKRSYVATEEDCKIKSNRLIALEKEHFEELEQMRGCLEEKDVLIRSLKTEVEQLLKTKLEYEADLAEKQSLVEKEHEKIQNSVDKLSAAEDKALSLEEELRNTVVRCEKAISEKDRINGELKVLTKNLEKERELTMKDKSRFEENLLTVTSENERLMKKLKKIQNAAKSKQLKLREELKEIRQSFGRHREGLASLLDSLKKEVEDAKRTFTDDRRTLESAIFALFEEFEVLQEKNAELKTLDLENKKHLEIKCQKLESSISQIKKMEEMARAKAQELEDSKSLWNADIKKLSDRLNELQESYGEALKHSSDLEEKVASLLKALDEATSVASEKETTLQIQVAETRKVIEERDGLFKEIEQMTSQMRLLQKDATDYCDELSSLRTRLAEVDADVASLKLEGMAKEASIKELNKQLDAKTKEYATAITNLKEELVEAKKRIEGVQAEQIEGAQIISSKKKEISALEEQLSLLKDDIAMKDDNIKELSESKNILEEELQNKCRDVEILESGRAELEKLRSFEAEESKKAVNEWITKESLLRVEIAEVRKSVEDAERKIVAYQEQELSFTKQIEILTEELELSNAKYIKMKEALESAEECVMLLKKDFAKRMVEKEALMEQCKREYLEKEAQFKEELNDKIVKNKQLGVSLEKSESSVRQSNALLQQLQDDLSKAIKEREELAKTVSSCSEERKALLERCLNTESDLDFERERAAENRRRFEEALSAMHELGRANQTLQMDISKQFSRKWLDDTEAVSCNTCSKMFSLTIRKHHCRMCGQIFCASCSSHTAQIPSNKNPVRVCNGCYEDLLNR